MANMCIILTELRSAASSKTKQLSSLICEKRSGQTVAAAAAAGPWHCALERTLGSCGGHIDAKIA